jgi:hypothetical protein
LRAVVRFDRNFKEMRSAHAFVHRKLGDERGALPGLQCRLTDDSDGRSTSFEQFGLDLAIRDLQGLVADIFQCEYRARRLLVRECAEINFFLIYREARARAGIIRRDHLHHQHNANRDETDCRERGNDQ